MRPMYVAGGVLLGVAALYLIWYQTEYLAADESEDGGSVRESFGLLDDSINIATDVAVSFGGVVGMEAWRAPAKYQPAIRAAESKYAIPQGMLERLLYQECRYREDIITGKVRSKVGALGIAQFMPATAAELGVNPLDPFAAIDASGKYLSRMFGLFGAWDLALAAYNWGPGNVRKKGLAKAPKETRNYYGSILADTGYTGGWVNV